MGCCYFNSYKACCLLPCGSLTLLNLNLYHELGNPPDEERAPESSKKIITKKVTLDALLCCRNL